MGTTEVQQSLEVTTGESRRYNFENFKEFLYLGIRNVKYADEKMEMKARSRLAIEWQGALRHILT